MSDPHRAASGLRFSGAVGDNASARPMSSVLIRKRRSIAGVPAGTMGQVLRGHRRFAPARSPYGPVARRLHPSLGKRAGGMTATIRLPGRGG